MFSSSPAPGNAPLPAYYGYRLASLLTGAAPVSSLDMAVSSVFGFESVGEHRRAVLLINAKTAQSETVRVGGFREQATLQTWTYSAASASLALSHSPGNPAYPAGPRRAPPSPESIVVLIDSGF